MALHADCMSGYQFSLRQPALQQLSLMIKIFDKARALGDFSNISPDPNARLLHHGTPEERAQAFNNGVNLAQQYATRNHG